MIPLCQHHHDAIHHRGWSLAIDERRTITWTRPDGTEDVRPYVPLADPHLHNLFDAGGARDRRAAS